MASPNNIQSPSGDAPYQAAFSTYTYPTGPHIAPSPPGATAPAPGSPSNSRHTNDHSPASTTKSGGGGLLGSITKVGADLARKGLAATNKAVDTMQKKLDETLAKHYGDSAVLNLFQTGNVVQLISKTTGRTLQILQASNGQLVLDGNGPDDPNAFHTHFIVQRESSNVVLLHNNFNYIAVVNGYTTIHRAAEQGHVTLHCRLVIQEPASKYVSLESTQEKNHSVGVSSTGALKSALTTRPTDRDAWFAVRLIYSPHGVPHGVNSKSKS